MPHHYSAQLDFARSRRGSAEWERNKGDISKIIRWATRGEGAARIGWGKECDFCACLDEFRGKVPAHQIKGWCAKLHHRALGRWPGPRSQGDRCPC